MTPTNLSSIGEPRSTHRRGCAMYLGSLIGCMILLQPVWAQAPFISSGGVTNAASYKSATTGIAQGSYFVIYRGNLGAAAAPTNPVPLQTKLRNTQMNVRCSVDGKTHAAYIYYVSPTQLAGILRGRHVI